MFDTQITTAADGKCKYTIKMTRCILIFNTAPFANWYEIIILVKLNFVSLANVNCYQLGKFFPPWQVSYHREYRKCVIMHRKQFKQGKGRRVAKSEVAMWETQSMVDIREQGRRQWYAKSTGWSRREVSTDARGQLKWNGGCV